MSATDMRYRCVGALLLALFIGGCTKQATCDLLNNSGSEITIIRSQDDREERMQVSPGSSVLLGDWLFWSYQITVGAKTLRYSPENPGNEFVVDQGFGPWMKRVFHAQLEPDGRLYLLKLGQPTPAKDFVKQPASFPLAPISQTPQS